MTDISFADLGLSEPLLRALNGAGYTHPTPIQARTIPALLEGRDVLGIAQTGTGKTAAFALPVLQQLAQQNRRAEARSPRALVLAPTRELAVQIARSFDTYGKGLGEQALHALKAGGWLKPDALIVFERGASEALIHLDGYEVLDVRRYGAASVTFLKPQA